MPRFAFLVLLALLLAPAAARAFDPPEVLADRMRMQPDRFLDDMAVLVAGHGRDGALDAAGAAEALALARAALRQAELRRLLRADLDDDGAVTAAELAVLMRAEGAGPRGRLAVAHLRADADGDGAVTAAELAAHARRTAATRSAALAADLAAVMALDLDSDGRLTLPEVRRALALVAGGA